MEISNGQFAELDARIAAIPVYFKDRILTEKDLIPAGFKEIARAKGDLNDDEIDDIAIIIRDVAHDKITDTGNQKQIVLVFLGNKSGGFSYWKIGAKHFVDNLRPLVQSFAKDGTETYTSVDNIKDGRIGTLTIPQYRKNGGVDELAIKNRILIIGADISNITGFSGIFTQKWQKKGDDLYLIEFTISDFARLDANYVSGDIDVNYLTGIITWYYTSEKKGKKIKSRIQKIKQDLKPVLWTDFDYYKFSDYGNYVEKVRLFPSLAK